MTDQRMRPECGRRAWMQGALAAGLVAAPLLRTAAGDRVPAFRLGAEDIAELAQRGERLHLRLTEPARARLARFTGAHIGRLVRVTAGDTVLLEGVVRSEVDSGLLSSHELADEARALRLSRGGKAP